MTIFWVEIYCQGQWFTLDKSSDLNKAIEKANVDTELDVRVVDGDGKIVYVKKKKQEINWQVEGF